MSGDIRPEKDYMVKDYSKTTNDKPEIRFCRGSQIFSEINRAKLNDFKIAVYEIGDCVLDWS